VTSKRFIVGFLVIVAAVAAFSIYLSRIVERTDTAVADVLSPDKTMKAVKLTLSGHGASPFCLDSISVMLSAYPDEFAESRKEYEVYSGPCGKFASGEASPKVEWRSPTELRISYADVPAASGAHKRVMKAVDVTKSVHVEFVAAP